MPPWPNSNDLMDEPLVKGTWLLSNFYQNCNVAVYELAEYDEVEKDKNCIAAMEELSMIEKNMTSELEPS